MKDKRVSEVIGTQCKRCEFRCSTEEESDGKISGFKTCWKSQLHWSDKDFEQGTILDIWNFKGAKKLFTDNIISLKDVTEEHIGVPDSLDSALLPKERQWLQVKKIQDNDSSFFLILMVCAMRWQVGSIHCILLILKLMPWQFHFIKT